jgi:hypothetical protein
MRSPFAHRWLTLGLLAAAGASLAGCAALANPHADNTVVVTQLNLASCQSPAAPPATGWINCGGAVALYETMTITSGWVSVHMVYPEPGSEYSGEQAVDRTQPGDMVVQLNNPHLTKCVASYPTTIDVYDGRVNDANARLLKKLSFTVRNSC